jgi:hypothetical protein
LLTICGDPTRLRPVTSHVTLLYHRRVLRMTKPDLKAPVRPLHVQIDAGRYRQACRVRDLTALLLCGGWPQAGRIDPVFHGAPATSLDTLELYAETARGACERAAPAAGMQVLASDMAKMRKAADPKRRPRLSGAVGEWSIRERTTLFECSIGRRTGQIMRNRLLV